MSTFAELLAPFFDDLFRLEPVLATWLGNHDHDDAWPDPSAAGAAARLGRIDRWTEAFAALPEGELTRDESIDREIVLRRLAAARFADEVFREEAWNPLAAVYTLGDGIHLLLSREFAPVAVRLASAAARIEGIPAYLAAFRGRLGSDAARPVSRLHAETAAAHLSGIADLCDEALALAAAADEEGELAPVRSHLEPAAKSAKAAIESLRGPPAEQRHPARDRRRPPRAGSLRRADAAHARRST